MPEHVNVNEATGIDERTPIALQPVVSRPDSSKVAIVDELEAGPLQKLVMADLNWARKQYEQGAFAEYGGLYLAIANFKTYGASDDIVQLRSDAFREANLA